MLRIEICLGIVTILCAFAFPNLGSRWFERIESGFSRFAQRRALSVAVVGILAVVARLAVLPVLPVPSPAIHDEFSYLLMSDTFAHGRLANPTHPMWVHFETFQVIQVPTYVSKYYPAQGLFLAAGQVVFGHPFWGVLLSSALMCAAICWMLQGWMSPAWALLGGILAVVRLGTFSYWANSYWGGAVAALGGALVLGALPRIKEEQRVRDAAWMGIGLALLFNSRPYESLFLAVPIAIALLVWLLRKDEQRIQKKVLCVILPLGIILTVTVAAMAFYFWKTTGQPFRPPYLVYEATYSSRPAFPWMPLKAPPPYPSFALLNYQEGNLLAPEGTASVSFIRSTELSGGKSAGSLRVRRTASFAEHAPPDFCLLAFLSRTYADGTVSDPAVGIARRGKPSRFSGSRAISLAGCGGFLHRNGVASRFLSTLRCADNCLGLRVRFVDDEIHPALVLWGEARGLGNYQGNRCVLRSACSCSYLSANFGIRFDSSKTLNLGSCHS